MKDNYIINIVGTQSVNGESEKTEFTTTGSYRIDGENKYIEYKEYENAATKKGSVATLTVNNDKVVTLSRDRDEDASLILEKNKRHICNYNTIMGPLTIGVFTKKFESTLDDKGGVLDIEYSLDVNCDVSSVNRLKINVEKIVEENKECLNF